MKPMPGPVQTKKQTTSYWTKIALAELMLSFLVDKQPI